MANWNRKTRRQFSRYGITEERLKDEYARAAQTAAENALRSTAAGMMLALHEHFGFPDSDLKQLAIETMANVNGALCVSELVERCKTVTGYDVDEPLESYVANTWEDEL